jgi:hypothetical protein
MDDEKFEKWLLIFFIDYKELFRKKIVRWAQFEIEMHTFVKNIIIMQPLINLYITKNEFVKK